jgi:hypothetical protein
MVRAPVSGEPLSSSFLPQLLSAPQPPAAADFLPMNVVAMRHKSRIPKPGQVA